MNKTSLMMIALLAFAVAESPAEKGLRIAKEADASQNGFIGSAAETEMLLINAYGAETKRKMLMDSMETKNDGDKSRIEFLWPADVKGTKLLTWAHKVGNDDQWLYLPALNNIKRISSRSKTGSFMGSEFSYEDLGSQEVEKYSYKFLGDEKHQGRDTHKIERIPLDKDSGYSKQIQWIDKEYMNVTKIEYYDRKGELLKTGYFDEYKKLQKWWRVHKITMENHQTKKKSILKWNKQVVGKKFSSIQFTAGALED